MNASVTAVEKKLLSWFCSLVPSPPPTKLSVTCSFVHAWGEPGMRLLIMYTYVHDSDDTLIDGHATLKCPHDDKLYLWLETL